MVYSSEASNFATLCNDLTAAVWMFWSNLSVKQQSCYEISSFRKIHLFYSHILCIPLTGKRIGSSWGSEQMKTNGLSDSPVGCIFRYSSCGRQSWTRTQPNRQPDGYWSGNSMESSTGTSSKRLKSVAVDNQNHICTFVMGSVELFHVTNLFHINWFRGGSNP